MYLATNADLKTLPGNQSFPQPDIYSSARITELAPPRPVFESAFAQRADLVSRIKRCWY